MMILLFLRFGNASDAMFGSIVEELQQILENELTRCPLWSDDPLCKLARRVYKKPNWGNLKPKWLQNG